MDNKVEVYILSVVLLTQDHHCFTVSEVASDWHKLVWYYTVSGKNA